MYNFTHKTLKLWSVLDLLTLLLKLNKNTLKRIQLSLLGDQLIRNEEAIFY